ncbi:hypothetical protein P9D51_11140 [Bacillus sonorensis]|uniref:hypothetical protein n=1 Tax=Bacillus sonorensis TaxID=119858 RepID=UPI002DB92FA9|nr:hypothetical protein [Bacillus sonorensis]MEC1426659.1 hypothetical protein [Bacillus sonorensis]MEC1437348.1 hypothetical protein [Bacillus sonorensis]
MRSLDSEEALLLIGVYILSVILSALMLHYAINNNWKSDKPWRDWWDFVDTLIVLLPVFNIFYTLPQFIDAFFYQRGWQ